jgi:photosystem II stability/assembly factor-like uncharacterized protein
MSSLAKWSPTSSSLPSTNFGITSCAMDGTNAIAVGTSIKSSVTNGAIYYSNHSGVTWTTALNEPSNSLFSCSMVGSYAIAVGGNSSTSCIYYSSDNGQTWNNALNVSLTGTNSFDSCSMNKNSGQYAIAVAKKANTIYYSSNYGAPLSWTQTSSTLTYLASGPGSSISATGKYAIVTGADNNTLRVYIYYSENYGNNWSEILLTSTTGIEFPKETRACFMDGSNAIAIPSDFGAVQTAYVYYSSNYGASWSLSLTAPSMTFSGCCINGSNIIAVGINSANTAGVIYSSNNLGSTWTPITVSNELFDCYIDGTNAIAVGRDGIYYSIDTGSGFTTWTQSQLTSTDPGGDLFICCFLLGTRAIAGGAESSNYAGVIYYSPTNIVCFNEGTKILTDSGYKLVQDLRKGDLVKTLLNGFLPIEMIGKKEICNLASTERIKDQLYVLTNDNYPDVFEPLVITGCHCILVDEFKHDEQRQKTKEVLGNIYATDEKYRLPACVDDRCEIYEKKGNCTIYHIALENENYYGNYGIYANGLLVETCSLRYLKEYSTMTLLE